MNSENTTDIIIIGAGAAGLMAARELSKAGKSVIILEARNRIGGRIMPLAQEDFGYPAEGGAEFVHGEAPITKSLMREAGLTFIPEDGEIWSTRGGGFHQHSEFIEHKDILQQKLEEVTEEISIARFLDTHLQGEEYSTLRDSIRKMTEGYETADPVRMSINVLKEELFGKKYGEDGRIEEGYAGLINFLENECIQNGTRIILDTPVIVIEHSPGKVILQTSNKQTYQAQQVIITATLPTLNNTQFTPPLPEKIEAAAKIGFGDVIKILIKFKSQWWNKIPQVQLATMSFLLADEDFIAWWTQYPKETTTLSGWMAGPTVQKHKQKSDEELFEIGLARLAVMFTMEKEVLRKEVVTWRVMNWSADPYTGGSYSYETLDIKNARADLAEPINDTVFFAGEAVYSGYATATVEGALGSGMEVVEQILKSDIIHSI